MKIRLLIFPHRNTLKFLGMKSKGNYITWRAKNGFFSALDIKGKLITWSMVTGNMLYNKEVDYLDLKNGVSDSGIITMSKLRKDFKIFRSDDGDYTYCANYNEHDNYTL